MRSLKASALAAFLFSHAIAGAASASAPPLARHTCANGLEVVVAEMHATPLVTIEVAAHNGAFTESSDYNGLSHLYEHMFFKGNAKLPDQPAYLARARELGITWNGTTNTERVNYYLTTTSEHASGAMEFMRDAIVTPRFDAKELERERVVVTGELDRNESDPFYFLWHTIEQKAYSKFPSYKDPLGRRATVLSATVEKMRTIQQRYYVPNNSVLVIAGDVRAADVFRQADALYASWARAEDPFVKHPAVVHPPLRRSELVMVKQPVENVTIRAVWHGPSTTPDMVADTYAADVLDQIAHDPGSRLQMALVDSGRCVSAELWYSTQKHTGEIVLSVEATPDKADACTAAMFAEVQKLHDPGYLTDEEIRNAEHRISVTASVARETTLTHAHAITFHWAVADLEYHAIYEDQVHKVARPDIARVVDRWLVGKPFVLGVMASEKTMNGAALEKRVAAAAGIGGAK